MTHRFRHRIAADLDRLGWVAENQAVRLHELAISVDTYLTAADVLRRDLGWPGSSDNPRVSGGGDTLTSVERAADHLWHINANWEDVRDAVAALVAHRNAETDLCNAVAHLVKHGKDLAAQNPPCCDSQVGKHGVEHWGDALCPLPGVKSGLCSRHYMAWYRARRADGIDTSRDHEQANVA